MIYLSKGALWIIPYYLPSANSKGRPPSKGRLLYEMYDYLRPGIIFNPLLGTPKDPGYRDYIRFSKFLFQGLQLKRTRWGEGTRISRTFQGERIIKHYGKKMKRDDLLYWDHEGFKILKNSLPFPRNFPKSKDFIWFEKPEKPKNPESKLIESKFSIKSKSTEGLLTSS